MSQGCAGSLEKQMNLSLGYITSRRDCRVEWFFDSLARQIESDDQIDIVVVDYYANEPQRQTETRIKFAKAFIAWSDATLNLVEPKPNIWQGKYQLPKGDPWWAKSNAINTFLCLAVHSFVAIIDDRSYLADGWLDAIKRAMDGNYAVCGRYEKRSNVKVENGIITDMGTELGLDHRLDLPFTQPTDNWMGGHGALPLEWCLAVGGFPESADSLGSEDSLFGMTLYNAGFPMKYDAKMLIIEDRTPGEIDGALRRSDFGESPNDASHALVNMFAGQRISLNPFNIRDMRDSVLAGNPFPPPSADTNHFFTGQPISEME